MDQLHEVVVFLEQQRDQRRLKIVADESGVPYDTLRKIMDKRTENPAFTTIERLRAYKAKLAADDATAVAEQRSAAG